VKSAPFQALLQQPNGSKVPCEGLHCLAERSHFVIDDTIGLFKHHLGGHQFHSSEEVEMALCEWLQIQEPDFYCDRIFKPVPSYGKCIIAFHDCAEK
jgi:hypothetical protein